jgi:hypothetical protein
VDLLDAYLSCLLHDIKKVLLNAKKGDPDYASWRPDHYKLDDLWTQIDPAKVALPKALSVHSDSLKNDHRIRLANLHHNEPTAPRRDLDPVAIYAIQAADKTHKALYFPEEPRQSGSGPDIEVNRKLPCHYPFFGLPCPPQDVRRLNGETRHSTLRKSLALCPRSEIHQQASRRVGHCSC